MNFCTLWLGAPASQVVQKPFHRQDRLPEAAPEELDLLPESFSGDVTRKWRSIAGSDCLIAKVDGPGQVDLPRFFGKCWPPHLYIFLHIFAYFSYFLGSKIDLWKSWFLTNFDYIFCEISIFFSFFYFKPWEYTHKKEHQKLRISYIWTNSWKCFLHTKFSKIKFSLEIFSRTSKNILDFWPPSGHFQGLRKKYAPLDLGVLNRYCTSDWLKFQK